MNKLDKILNKTIVVLGIALIIVIAVGFVIQIINGKETGSQTNSTATKIINIEANTIESSSPIPIKHLEVFGSWANITKNITYEEQAYFSVENSSNLYVLNNGFYVPTYEVVKALGNSNPNLIGQKVYLSFYVYAENTSTIATYIVKSENIQGNEIIWNMTFDGNINNAINSRANYSTGKLTISYLNGVILLNGTGILSPKNPAIDEELLLHNNS